ncbi:guanosine ABC transporter (ATP-binding protein) [Petrocella atlantisensis]|uniref:Guanosine ABC transporter (ATP-binding protein) n=1 Tax=Petrocella atlantisensis TaxID=2173034 RepID=A0A3P7PFR5_9FIRM|nr:ABC transporter ATP-binding protein [Petrocella atlantisensis]VDN47738.1 guanosine ABC transporter (ATP-binding protein) [Petrocella atlantisensis]
MEYVVEMLNITKEFPGIKANDDVTLRVEKGEIHALLGENGAGKSTLMSVLFGLYQAEKGIIKIHGKEVDISNPNVANKHGIGMVHQHFKLVHNFTVTENIILGLEPTKSFGRIDIDKAAKKVIEISQKYGLKVDPHSKIEDITVGMQQRVEILKMLYRNAEILIFDEPTAVLTPQEIKELMSIMRELVKEGKSIVLITHKLKEISMVADHCTVLRRGRYIGTVKVSETTEEEMAEMMVGREVSFEVDKEPATPSDIVLKIENLNIKNTRNLMAVKNLNLEVKAGEILCVAGIDGNGQSELIKGITGLSKIESGKILFDGIDIAHDSVRNRTLKGIGHIPEDRHKYGLVLDFSLEENMALQSYFQEPLSKKGILQPEAIRKHSDILIEEFDIRSGQGSITSARSMSGGNQQKAIIAREVERSPRLLIAAQPTRGLDVGAIEYIHQRLVKERDSGKAVLLMSLEMEEVLNLSDRIAVIYEGEIVGIVDASHTNENELGLMMAGSRKGKVD